MIGNKKEDVFYILLFCTSNSMIYKLFATILLRMQKMWGSMLLLRLFHFAYGLLHQLHVGFV